MATVKTYKGDTFIAPVIKIAAANFDLTYLSGSIVRFQIREKIPSPIPVVVTALTSNIITNILYEPITYTHNGITVTETLWNLEIAIILPKEVMEIPAGDYFFDYEVTYPNGVRETYYQNNLTVKQDASNG